MRKLITLKVEDDIKEVLQAVLMVEAEDKRKKNNPVNKIGTKEDEVHGEEDRATQMLSALGVTNMTIMQRTVTQTNVSIVVSLDILLKIADMKIGKKRRLTSQKKEKKKRHC